jgi:hypothetical protein
MSEQAFDPSAPIPNSDPRCPCALEPDSAAGDDAVVMGFGGEDGGQVRVAVHLDCPYHGGIVRAMQRTALKGFSIAPR